MDILALPYCGPFDPYTGPVAECYFTKHQAAEPDAEATVSYEWKGPKYLPLRVTLSLYEGACWQLLPLDLDLVPVAFNPEWDEILMIRKDGGYKAHALLWRFRGKKAALRLSRLAFRMCAGLRLCRIERTWLPRWKGVKWFWQKPYFGPLES